MISISPTYYHGGSGGGGGGWGGRGVITENHAIFTLIVDFDFKGACQHHSLTHTMSKHPGSNSVKGQKLTDYNNVSTKQMTNWSEFQGLRCLRRRRWASVVFCSHPPGERQFKTTIGLSLILKVTTDDFNSVKFSQCKHYFLTLFIMNIFPQYVAEGHQFCIALSHWKPV
jgi:hypothetical protein